MVSQDCDDVHGFDWLHQYRSIGPQQGQLGRNLGAGMDHIGDAFFHQSPRDRRHLAIRQLTIENCRGHVFGVEDVMGLRYRADRPDNNSLHLLDRSRQINGKIHIVLDDKDRPVREHVRLLLSGSAMSLSRRQAPRGPAIVQ